MFSTLFKTFFRKLGDDGDLYVFFIPNKFKYNWIGFMGKKEWNALNIPPLKKIKNIETLSKVQSILVLRRYR